RRLVYIALLKLDLIPMGHCRATVSQASWVLPETAAAHPGASGQFPQSGSAGRQIRWARSITANQSDARCGPPNSPSMPAMTFDSRRGSFVAGTIPSTLVATRTELVSTRTTGAPTVTAATIDAT